MTAHLGRLPGIRLAGVLLAALGLLLTGEIRGAAAGDVNPCSVDRPCITDLFVDGGILKARWDGDSEKYNLEVRSDNGAHIKKYDVEQEGYGWTVAPTTWGDTYTFMVQGCTDPLIGKDDCTPWASKEIKLQRPPAPENVRISGGRIHFDRVGDHLDTRVRLRGLPWAGGDEVFITTGSGTTRSFDLPDGYQDSYRALKVCAWNGAGERCTEVPTRVIASPKPAPQLPQKPSTPQRFEGSRGPIGLRIMLTWADTSNEEYYYLTAVSAQTGEPVAFPLAAPAPKLGANTTFFVDEGNIAALVGGVEFRLQACNAGGCSPAATTVVE